jgi:hypothetical protein
MHTSIERGALLQKGIFTVDEVHYLKSNGFWPCQHGVFGIGDDSIGALSGKANRSDLPRRGVISIANKTAKCLAVTKSNSSYIYSAGYAVLTDGSLWVWGVNYNGQLGLGSSASFFQPTRVGTDSDWVKVVSVFQNAAFLLKSDGSMWGVGGIAAGRFGNGLASGNYLVPTRLNGSTTWLDVHSANGTSTSNHAMAVRSDGTMWAWGSNLSGKNGLNLTTGTTGTATQVGGDTDWAKVYCFSTNTLAIKSNGTLWACGTNNYGFNRNGTISGSQTTFIQIGTDTDWAAISGYLDTGYILKTDGRAFFVGNNADGRAAWLTSYASTGTAPASLDNGLNYSWKWVEATPDGLYMLRDNGDLYYAGKASDSPVFMSDAVNANTGTSPILLRKIPTDAVASAGQNAFLISW